LITRSRHSVGRRSSNEYRVIRRTNTGRTGKGDDIGAKRVVRNSIQETGESVVPKFRFVCDGNA